MNDKRPVGRPPGRGKGRTMKTASLNMHPKQWQKMDKLAGGKRNRSAWLRDKIDKDRSTQG